MFEKINDLKNFGSFENFHWDNIEKLKNIEFKKFNILYGENYSGKTTLSRLFGAFENKILPAGVEQSNFSISYDQKDYTQTNFDTFPHNVVVYNEDFRKKNLSFFSDDNGFIESFTVVIGEDNQEILNQIEGVQNELGIDNSVESTGLYKEYYDTKQELQNTKTQKEDAEKKKNRLLKEKAQKIKLGRDYGNIRFDNYDRAKLESDIDNLDCQFTPEENISSLIQKANEPAINNLAQEQNYNFLAKTFIDKVKIICKETAMPAVHLKELDSDCGLKTWVEQGHKLHVNIDECKFCKSEIQPQRKEELSKYFNDNYNGFKKKIDDLSADVNHEILKVREINLSTKENFYAEYKDNIDGLRSEFSENLREYIQFLEKLNSILLIKRDEHLFVEYVPEVKDFSIQDLDEIIEKYDSICEKNRKYHKSLSINVESAREALLQNIVYSISNEKDYKDLKDQIDCLNPKIDRLSNDYEDIQKDIQSKKLEIDILKSDLSSEEASAEKINILIEKHFGHPKIRIETQSHRDSGVVFDVQRNGKKANNLSEGERTLIAFCYFITKLETIDNPIIWIDDPICSLDSNHIYFIYSLIKYRILTNASFKQLFISTHSLDFLSIYRKANLIEEKLILAKSQFI